MSTPALTLAIHLLGTAVVAAALTSTTSCLSGDCGDWAAEDTPLELGVTVDLHAVSPLLYESDEERIYEGIAVGAEGTIVIWGVVNTGYVGSSGPFTEVVSIGLADLRAISAQFDSWWVVGDAGTAAVSGDHGQSWIMVDLPTTADLHTITRIASQLIVAGDEVVLVQNADGTWTQVTAPDGGWGQLRALYPHAGRVYAVGLGGVIWSTNDSLSEWVAEASGTQGDLFALGTLYHRNQHEYVVAVGAGGTLLLRKSKGWDRVDNDERVDLVGYGGGAVLGANGELFDVDSRGKLKQVDTFVGARAISDGVNSGVIAVGDGGAAFRKDIVYCEGRPFLVDGMPNIASLRRADSWCDAPRADSERVAFADTLAAAWAEDGLYEHASIASFARFGLELLALGAPPRLLRDVHAAIADELRHAKACFELARRFAGVEGSPGPMPIAANALARVGDPIATALGLFEEACVNESVAACAAAEAAARSEDPEIRRVLEGIAADERRHAVAGWAALRWLLDTYGDQVRVPLRTQLARLRPAWVPVADELDDQHSRWGRLSARQQAALRNEVLEQLVRPLAHAMLFPESFTQLIDEEPCS